jgi:hypothetical protein
MSGVGGYGSRNTDEQSSGRSYGDDSQQSGKSRPSPNVIV